MRKRYILQIRIQLKLSFMQNLYETWTVYTQLFLYNRTPSNTINLNLFNKIKMPIPVVERSKAWVCSRSLARIRGSNPARGMDVRL